MYGLIDSPSETSQADRRYK